MNFAIQKKDLLSLIDFIGNHFEIILSIEISVVVLLALYVLMTRFITANNPINWFSAINKTLPNILLVILAGFCVMLEYVYWKNYGPVEKGFVERERKGKDNNKEEIFTYQDTSWINDPLRLFYVKEGELRSVRLNGSDDQQLFKLEDPIIEYTFSPDNRYVLTLTEKKLVLVDKINKKIYIIETLLPADKVLPSDFKASINNCQWAPDGSKFIYEVSRWSKFTTQNNIYVYDIKTGRKNAIKNPTRKITSLYWDKTGTNLYYFLYQERDTSIYNYPFDVKVYKVPLATYVPEFFCEIPYDKKALPLERLSERGIDIEENRIAMAFRENDQDHLLSANGMRVGIDADDYFYYIPNQWFRRRYFRIPRRPDPVSQKFAYDGGDLLVNKIRWLPGDRYVLMRHRDWGNLLFEPASGKLGLLGLKDAANFGWEVPSNH